MFTRRPTKAFRLNPKSFKYNGLVGLWTATPDRKVWDYSGRTNMLGSTLTPTVGPDLEFKITDHEIGPGWDFTTTKQEVDTLVTDAMMGLDSASNFLVSVWANIRNEGSIESPGNGNSRLVSSGGSSNATGWAFLGNASGTDDLEFYVDGTKSSQVAIQILDETHLYSIWHDSTNSDDYWYRDGEAIFNDTTAQGTPTASALTLHIGNRPNVGDPVRTFDGVIFEVGIWVNISRGHAEAILRSQFNPLTRWDHYLTNAAGVFIPVAAAAPSGRIMSSLAWRGGLAGQGGIAGIGGGLAA